MTQTDINKCIASATNTVGNTWPLYSFVTSNPLAGYQDMPFEKAVRVAKNRLGTEVYPSGEMFEQALDNGAIDKAILKNKLEENGYTDSVEFYLSKLNIVTSSNTHNEYDQLDRITTKWLSAFFDEGLAEWEMPNKKDGFFKAWRLLAKYDSALGIKSKDDIPKTPEETIGNLVKAYSKEDITEIFTQHLAALPGWTGYIKHRIDNQTEWQKSYPITLMDYLAFRLFIAKTLNIDLINPKQNNSADSDLLDLKHIFLQSWEASWQDSLKTSLQNNTDSVLIGESIPDAQFVFCIDTRSEVIRRHIEDKGNYETFGYAGFFGIAMDYENLDNGIVRKSCPPILPSSYKTLETPKVEKQNEFTKLKRTAKRNSFKNYVLRRLKNMLPSAFGFVEGSGIFYGVAMVLRTLSPSKSDSIKTDGQTNPEHICEPHLNHANSHTLDDIATDEKVAIVKTAFDLLGWKTFAPVVVFAGHGSHTSNNPFASSLDCGACAASPGRHNARMLAKLANDKQVRSALSVKFGVEIPNDTIFIGAEHNTTTDDIELFDSDVPKQFEAHLKKLKQDLAKAQLTATAERLHLNEDNKKAAIKKSLDWSETRPEWGLAKNAGFIVGPRNLTQHLNLNGRCFLHSYDWNSDADGKALEAIMQGPMVVTQWINNHYYFSTVDNDSFGGGNKITHNVIGKFGVVQGNGGDLKFGLPLQSLNSTDNEVYHQPLRLSVVINAPKTRVSEILLNNPNLKNLIDNEWIYLIVMDPLQSNEMLKYEKNLKWLSLDHKKEGKTINGHTMTRKHTEKEVLV